MSAYLLIIRGKNEEDNWEQFKIACKNNGISYRQALLRLATNFVEKSKKKRKILKKIFRHSLL